MLFRLKGDKKNIIFLKPLNKRDLSRLMNSCDIGMQLLANIPAFYYGTSPNKFFDYLSAGLPVFTNYPGWVADLIIENNCGFVCVPESPELFADKIVDIIKNKSSLKKMGQSAFSLAKTNFRRTDLSKKWLNWVLN